MKFSNILKYMATLKIYNIIICLCRFADVFSKHIRIFLLILYVGAAGSLVWFTLLIQGTIPNSTGRVTRFYTSLKNTYPLHTYGVLV